MFYLKNDNLPLQRAKKARKVLANSAKDNTQMVAGLSTSLGDMAGVVENLAQQVADLSAMIAAQASDDDDDDSDDE